jgi:hypothetical protein
VPQEKCRPGHVQHTIGWPLQHGLMDKTYGGSFLYHMAPDLVLVGVYSSMRTVLRECLEYNTHGGSFLYHMAPDLVLVGAYSFTRTVLSWRLLSVLHGAAPCTRRQVTGA